MNNEYPPEPIPEPPLPPYDPPEPAPQAAAWGRLATALTASGRLWIRPVAVAFMRYPIASVDN